MSLDIYLEDAELSSCECVCEKCENKHESSFHETLYEANITHNLVKMADKCGLYECLWCPIENKIKIASDLIPHLEKGLKELIENPDKYTQYNPENGWGTYEGLIKFSTNLLEACEKYPKSTVHICR